MSDLTPEQAARKQGKVALVLDELGVLFYIELLNEYNSRRTPIDAVSIKEENYLRREYELLFGKGTE